MNNKTKKGRPTAVEKKARALLLKFAGLRYGWAQGHSLLCASGLKKESVISKYLNVCLFIIDIVRGASKEQEQDVPREEMKGCHAEHHVTSFNSIKSSQASLLALQSRVH